MLYFRRAVPKDARGAFGGRSEVWLSLKTSEIPVARLRLQRALNEFEEILADARGEMSPSTVSLEPFKPSKRELEVRVRAAFKERVDRIRSVNSGKPEEREAAQRRLEDLKAFQRSLKASRGLSAEVAPIEVVWQAEALCEKHNWNLTENDEQWWALIDLIARSKVEATERHIQMLEGRPSRNEDVAFSAEEFLRDAKEQEDGAVLLGAPVSILGLFESYVKERKPEPATIKSYKAKIAAFQSFLGHDDARRITKRDVAEWKSELLEQGGAAGQALSPKTVRATYLSAIKVSLKQGVDNGLLRENVAVGVTVAGRKRPVRTRLIGFSDEEAEKILRATLAEHRRSLTEPTRLARRWLPWLCAYTGARVDEMSQLRGSDVAKIDDIWTIKITPEAGGVKDGNARVIAMHPHLVAQGFPKVAQATDGPLFYDPSNARGGSAAHRQSKKVGQRIAEWVRKEIGIDDERVAPNHGWRHRFKTVARDCRMMPEIRDFIQGHVPRNESEGYGDTSPKATLAEIALIPDYEIEGV